MSDVRRTSAILLTAAALAVSGCGADAKKSSGEPSESVSSPPTTAATTTAPATAIPTGAATPSTSPSDGPTEGSTDCGSGKAVPEGTWSGPITMDVQGKGGDTGFADTKGTGTLRMVVANGKVTGGRWNVTWKSSGHADTGQAAATLKLTGTIKGGLKGPAAKPVLPGTWRIHGIVTITKPVHNSAPVDETGQDTETMAIESATCDAVSGTFLPSFNSKDAAASFNGTARWTGTRQD